MVPPPWRRHLVADGHDTLDRSCGLARIASPDGATSGNWFPQGSFRKSADSYTVLGPWLTTADEIADPEQLTLWLTLNGTERQRSSTAAMTVGIRHLIEIASSAYTLYPGDILMTGTPEGVGAVSPGDIIVTGCDGLGEMTVPVGI
ncbi:fumarylacetoacetate hydrolase family protein [Bradyrhizobium sp. CW10]|nr:fumarylacetoacetate hydrolase family protein [Bradyrhizobium sp. CW10]